MLLSPSNGLFCLDWLELAWVRASIYFACQACIVLQAVFVFLTLQWFALRSCSFCENLLLHSCMFLRAEAIEYRVCLF